VEDAGGDQSALELISFLSRLIGFYGDFKSVPYVRTLKGFLFFGTAFALSFHQGSSLPWSFLMFFYAALPDVTLPLKDGHLHEIDPPTSLRVPSSFLR